MTEKLHNPTLNPSDSPCIGICSTTFGDDICRGCKRSKEAIILWNRWEPAQRVLENQKIDALMQAVLTQYLEVVELSKVLFHLKRKQAPIIPGRSEYSAVHLLLRYYAPPQPSDWETLGLRVKPPYSDWTTAQLLKTIEEHLLAQASSTYNS